MLCTRQPAQLLAGGIAHLREVRSRPQVLVVRRESDAARHLRRVYSIGAQRGLEWQRDWEQTAMAHYYAEGGASAAAFCIVPPVVLQSFYRDCARSKGSKGMSPLGVRR